MIKDLVSIIEEEIKANLNKMYINLSFLNEYTEKKGSKKEDNLLKNLKIINKSKSDHGFFCYKTFNEEKNNDTNKIQVFLITDIKEIKVKIYVGYYFVNSNEDIGEQVIKETNERFKKREAIYDFLENNNIITKAYARKIFRKQLNNFLSSNENDNIKF